MGICTKPLRGGRYRVFGSGILQGCKISSAPDGNMPLCRKGLFQRNPAFWHD
jgi:hypothetical protein